MGRIDEIVPFNDLGVKEFVKIMKESDINKLKQYIEKFRKLKIKLTIKEDAYLAISEKALSLNVGARGIKVVVEQMLKKILFNVFDSLESEDKIVEIIIDKNTVDDYNNYQIIRKSEVISKKPKTYKNKS